MAGELIEIQGTQVSLFRVGEDGRRVLDRRVALRSLAEALAGRGSAAAVGGGIVRWPGFLPPGTRLALARGPSLVLAIEQAPQVRRLAWRPGTMKDTGEGRQVALALPYVIYLVRFFQEQFEEMRLYYRAAPLGAGEDALSLPNLWNVQAPDSPLARCRACLRGRPALDGMPTGAQAEAVINFFWAAGFNMDVEDNAFDRSRGVDARVASLAAWEAATAADPLFPLGVPWIPTGLTIRRAMEHLLHWGHGGGPVADAADLADMMYRLAEAP